MGSLSYWTGFEGSRKAPPSTLGAVSSRCPGLGRLAPLAAAIGLGLMGCRGAAYDTTGVAATRAPQSSPNQTALLTTSIERAGAFLCALNTIDPNDQGGLAVIHVYSFSGSERCDPGSTSGRGVLYVLDYPRSDDANLFLSSVADNGRFAAGWDVGKIAIAVGAGTPARTQSQIVKALGDRADQVFP